MQTMSALLHSSMSAGRADMASRVIDMEALEKNTAGQIRALFTELSRNLITPFDREDIHYLATDLSNIGRSILYIIRQVKSYDLDCAGSVTETVTKQVKEAIDLLAQVLQKLKDAKALGKLGGACNDIHRILHTCDDMLDARIVAVLREEKDQFALIKMMDHYEVLQKLLANIGNTVNVCESIVIKYG